MTAPPLRVYLVDDEPPAVERLERMLAGVPEIQVAGSASDPAAALDFLSREAVDAVFLDIEMLGINGFELLARLPEQPLVIFTTAYDQYALKAFAVNSIDFLLDPVDQEQLARALRKLERLRSAGKPKWMRQPEMQALLHERVGRFPAPLAAGLSRTDRLARGRADAPGRVVRGHSLFRSGQADVRGGGRRNSCVDQSIAELERRREPERFIRIHRSE